MPIIFQLENHLRDQFRLEDCDEGARCRTQDFELNAALYAWAKARRIKELRKRMARSFFSSGTHKSSFSFLGAVLFFALFSATAALGGTFTARSPEDFVRSAGAPVTVTRSFTVLDPTTSFTLLIHNGGSNNQYRRVSSALIAINGTTIAGPSDFNQELALLQKPVS